LQSSLRWLLRRRCTTADSVTFLINQANVAETVLRGLAKMVIASSPISLQASKQEAVAQAAKQETKRILDFADDAVAKTAKTTETAAGSAAAHEAAGFDLSPDDVVEIDEEAEQLAAVCKMSLDITEKPREINTRSRSADMNPEIKPEVKPEVKSCIKAEAS
jgi:hypothetical protein